MNIKNTIEKLPGYNHLVLPLHWWQARQACLHYHHPAQKLRVIGVTGTNGKTTTCFMIWKMLNHAGHRTGLLTTVGWGIDDPSETTEETTGTSVPSTTENESYLPLQKQLEHMTTERVDVLNERIRTIADAGAEFLVLEVTSHALAQFRIYGIPIEIAVFTNLTHEHLDYHKTFANYRAAKLKLFQHAKTGIINADDPNAKYFEEAIKYHHSPDSNIKYDIISYGINHGDLRATDIKLKSTGIKYSCGDIKIKTHIPGEFNVYNSLAAVAVGQKLGLSPKTISSGIYALESVEGRMNTIQAGQDFQVIVDYAHTPDALEKVFASVKPALSEKQRIISVHGGAGRRDESTRAIRGEILGKNSDIVIITEDDSRDEDPTAIAAQFVSGVEKAGKVKGKDLFVQLDREKAIRQALKLAKKDDLVLILGKGHEKTILRADGPHDFEDIKVATKILHELQK